MIMMIKQFYVKTKSSGVQHFYNVKVPVLHSGVMYFSFHPFGSVRGIKTITSQELRSI